MIFNMVGGGGSSGSKSSIIVTAPTGSTVTCSKGDVTKNDEENNGTWTFKNCDVGDWTIHAISENEEQETSTVVSISEDGQLMRYHVTLAYFAATISVTYPVGSICTCTKDTKVYTAPNTSGTVVFTVPETGDWLVSCNNGLSGDEYKEKSQTVSITADGQSENVNLQYSPLFLYNKGDQCTDVSGGWAGHSYVASTWTSVPKEPTVTFNSDVMMFSLTSTGAGNGATLFAQKKINISTWDRITFVITETNHNSVSLGISSDKDEDFTVIAFNLINKAGTYTMDLSGVTGEVYVFIGMGAVRSKTATTKISEVYLEMEV